MRTEPASRDLPVPYPRHLTLLATCGSLAATFWVVSRSPQRVEAVFVEGFGGVASTALARLFGLVPFSVAEGLQLALAGWLALSLFLGLRQWRAGRRSLKNLAAHGSLRLISVAAVLLTFFYGVWGLNYARAPALDRLGWEAERLEGAEGIEEVAALAEQLIAIVNHTYLQIHGTEDAGVPTGPLSPRTDTRLDAAYVEITNALDLRPRFAVPRGPAKPLWFSPITSWLGISGFYFPFTGEANYNTQPPAWQQPHTIAHEKAHQRGIASEDEANFFGFLACIHSDDPMVAYSGWLFAQRRILTTLLRADRARGRALLAERLPGVQRDVDAANEFWRQWRGLGHSLGSTVNDAYLRTNRVEGGIRSYGRVSRLLIAYARQHEGRFPEPAPRSSL